MDFSTTKIYDISGKQLTGSNFPLYFEKMDVSMSYSTDNSLGIAGISMWDPVTPLINAYGVNSGSG
jgi:hypothetical protein